VISIPSLNIYDTNGSLEFIIVINTTSNFNINNLKTININTSYLSKDYNMNKKYKNHFYDSYLVPI
jgi:hypothetical protein